MVGVALGMSFPAAFVGIGDFKFTTLFVPILQIIMFGMGTTLSVADFARVFRMPGGVFIGLACQFTIMPLLGFTLAHAFGFPPEIAAGLVVVGVSPSGLASNVMAYIAKANLALSVTMTAASTLLATIITPLLMRLLAGETDRYRCRGHDVEHHEDRRIPRAGGVGLSPPVLPSIQVARPCHAIGLHGGDFCHDRADGRSRA